MRCKENTVRWQIYHLGFVPTVPKYNFLILLWALRYSLKLFKSFLTFCIQANHIAEKLNTKSRIENNLTWQQPRMELLELWMLKYLVAQQIYLIGLTIKLSVMLVGNKVSSNFNNNWNTILWVIVTNNHLEWKPRNFIVVMVFLFIFIFKNWNFF